MFDCLTSAILNQLKSIFSQVRDRLRRASQSKNIRDESNSSNDNKILPREIWSPNKMLDDP